MKLRCYFAALPASSLKCLSSVSLSVGYKTNEILKKVISGCVLPKKKKITDSDVAECTGVNETVHYQFGKRPV